MSTVSLASDGAPPQPIPRAVDPAGSPHPLVGYLAAFGLVVAAAILAFVVEHLLAAPELTLIFVLPVVIAATTFGWGPSLLAVIASVLAFDFFFTEPRFSLRIESPTDIWSAALLLVIAAIVSTVAAQARRRSIEAQLAAGRAEALHDLARLVVESASADAVVAASADALSRIFQAPAAVLLERNGALAPGGLAGGASLGAADEEAARWALANNTASRAESFPFDAATFDFWPIRRGSGPGLVLGVGLAEGRERRPANPAWYVELVGAYLATSLSQEP